MKRKSLLLLLFITFYTNSSWSEEVWKITSLDWQPYTGKELPNQGRSIEKLRSLLKQKGIKLEVEYYPWIRAQKLAQTKDYVGYFPAWPEEVGEGFTRSSIIDWSSISLIKKKHKEVTYNQDISEIFNNYKVGFVKTFIYPDSVMSAIKQYSHNTRPASTDLTLLKALEDGKSSIIITDPNVIQYHAKRENIKDIDSFAELEKKGLVIAFRDGVDNQKRIEIINELTKEQ